MDIREQLVREMSGSEAPPIGSLVADAEVGGMKARRRRHGLLGGAAVGVAVLAVIGTIALVSALPRTGAAPLQAGAPPVMLDPSAGASAHPTAPSKSAPPSDAAQYAAGKPVVMLLEHLVAPHGHFTEVEFDAGSFLYNDGHGAATISALVSNQPMSYGADVTGMNCPAASSGFTCEVRHLPGGVVARIMTMGPYLTGCPEKKCSIKDRRVEIQRLDGVYVAVDAYNGPQGHDRSATRTATILSTNQLIAIATKPQWSLHMS